MSNAIAPVRLTITGNDAREIRSHVNHHIRPLGASWVEVQAMRECQHGCKLHVRQRGAVRQYALLHYAGYGCALGRDEATRTVPVSVRPTLPDTVPLRLAIDADCPSCGYPERFFEPSRGVFGCSSLNPQPCGYESAERNA